MANRQAAESHLEGIQPHALHPIAALTPRSCGGTSPVQLTNQLPLLTGPYKSAAGAVLQQNERWHTCPEVCSMLADIVRLAQPASVAPSALVSPFSIPKQCADGQMSCIWQLAGCSLSAGCQLRSSFGAAAHHASGCPCDCSLGSKDRPSFESSA